MEMSVFEDENVLLPLLMSFLTISEQRPPFWMGVMMAMCSQSSLVTACPVAFPPSLLACYLLCQLDKVLLWVALCGNQYIAKAPKLTVCGRDCGHYRSLADRCPVSPRHWLTYSPQKACAGKLDCFLKCFKLLVRGNKISSLYQERIPFSDITNKQRCLKKKKSYTRFEQTIWGLTKWILLWRIDEGHVSLYCHDDNKCTGFLLWTK